MAVFLFSLGQLRSDCKPPSWREQIDNAPAILSSSANGGCERGFENFHALIKH